MKFQAFGKVTVGKNSQVKTDEANDTMDKDKRAEEMFEEEVQAAEKEIEEIRQSKGGKVGKIWEIRKKVIGGKKNETEASAVVNPKTGKLAITKDEIMKVSLQYCKETLENNKPAPEFRNEIEDKRKFVQKKMDMKDGVFEARFETFEKNVHKFKLSGKRNYDFLVKAHTNFHKIVFKLCQMMFKQEKFPEEFNNTMLHIIFKGKGRKEANKWCKQQ